MSSRLRDDGLTSPPLAFLRAELARGLVAAADLATLPVGRRLAIAGLVLIRQRPGSANGVVFVTIEDETGIANLIVWPAILERFRLAALGATLLYCRGRLQREESVIHLVAEDLRDMTARLNTLRERTGRDRTGNDPPPGKPPVVLRQRLPGYDSHDLMIPSRDFAIGVSNACNRSPPAQALRRRSRADLVSPRPRHPIAAQAAIRDAHRDEAAADAHPRRADSGRRARERIAATARRWSRGAPRAPAGAGSMPFLQEYALSSPEGSR